jgi:hypothetical protein
MSIIVRAAEGSSSAKKEAEKEVKDFVKKVLKTLGDTPADKKKELIQECNATKSAVPIVLFVQGVIKAELAKAKSIDALKRGLCAYLVEKIEDVVKVAVPLVFRPLLKVIGVKKIKEELESMCMNVVK